MKKYLTGGWAVFKNYIFAMIFFYIFFIGFYSRASLFSIGIFLIMILLLYSEMAHRAGVDKRKYGSAKSIDGMLYGMISVAPVIILQFIISMLDFNFTVVNFDVLKLNLIKGLAAPMLFIAKAGGYSVAGYAIAWAAIVFFSGIGYFAGTKGFDLNAYIRRLFGLQPRKANTKKHRR